jgi:hypothetical protein
MYSKDSFSPKVSTTVYRGHIYAFVQLLPSDQSGVLKDDDQQYHDLSPHKKPFMISKKRVGLPIH